MITLPSHSNHSVNNKQKQPSSPFFSQSLLKVIIFSQNPIIGLCAYQVESSVQIHTLF